MRLSSKGNEMTIGLFGRGRLGSAIAREAGKDVLWQIGRQGEPQANVDVVIHASSPEGLESDLKWAVQHKIPMVIGTTGWSLPQLSTLVSSQIGVVVAPNFSMAVALFARLATVLGKFASLDPQRDLYLMEHHHAAKQDAPSGTAKMLIEQLLKSCPRKTDWKIGGPVKPEELSVAVLRAGPTCSSHTIGVDHPSEVIEFQHVARSSSVFATGALEAARWVQGKKGVYQFSDVVAPILDSIFQAESRKS